MSYLIYCFQDIIIPLYNQHYKIFMRYCRVFFHVKSLKSRVYCFTLTVHLNSISRHTWLVVTVVDHAGLENEKMT